MHGIGQAGLHGADRRNVEVMMKMVFDELCNDWIFMLDIPADIPLEVIQATVDYINSHLPADVNPIRLT